MTWTANFTSPQGEAIVDFDVRDVVAGDATRYEADIAVALVAADKLMPNNEDGAQKVSLSGWRSDDDNGHTLNVVVADA